MAYRINERTVVAGVLVKVKGRRKLERLFKTLGGQVVSGSDKGWEIEFPTRSALDEYMQAAKANGAIFDSVEEN